jgi:hypothetical protein
MGEEERSMTNANSKSRLKRIATQKEEPMPEFDESKIWSDEAGDKPMTSAGLQEYVARNILKIRSGNRKTSSVMYLASDVDALIAEHAAAMAEKDERIAELADRHKSRDETIRYLNSVIVDRNAEITKLASRPTIWSYEQVCAANENKRVELAALQPLPEIGRLAVEYHEIDLPETPWEQLRDAWDRWVREADRYCIAHIGAAEAAKKEG